MSRRIEAIVLAGGKGTRMGSLTKETQKCLLPIDGKPILGHIIDGLSHSFDHVDLVVGTSYKEEQVKEYVDTHKPDNISVTYVPHLVEDEGYEIYSGLEENLHGPFLAMPGDVIIHPSVLISLIDEFEKGNADVVVAFATDTSEAETHGVGKVKDGLVTSLEWPAPEELDGDYLRDTTIWASDKRVFDILKQNPNPHESIGVVFSKALSNGRKIGGIEYSLPWIHVATPDDLQKSSDKIYRRSRDMKFTESTTYQGSLPLPPLIYA